MVFGTNIANFLAYLYHLIIGRILGPVSYGELATIISTLGLISTVFSFLGIVVVKFVSASKKDQIGPLYNWFLKNGLLFGVILFFLQLIITPILSGFLKIEIKTVVLLAPILFLTLLSFIIRSFLQGLLRFGRVVLISNIDLGGRLVFGIIFISLGLSSLGGVLGILIASFFSLFLGFVFLRDIRSKTRKIYYENSKKIFKYTLPVLLISFANNSFVSTDVVLAKHYLTPVDAGIYASLSTLGKIIFYATSPIVAVMFPIISKRYNQKKNYLPFFSVSASMIVLLGLAVLGIYYFFPRLMINILFGEKFLVGSDLLIYFGLFAFVFSLSNMFSSFYLSIGKTIIWFFVSFFAIFQILGILLYHSTIKEIIYVSLISVSLLLFFLILYFGYGKRKNQS